MLRGKLAQGEHANVPPSLLQFISDWQPSEAALGQRKWEKIMHNWSVMSTGTGLTILFRFRWNRSITLASSIVRQQKVSGFSRPSLNTRMLMFCPCQCLVNVSVLFALQTVALNLQLLTSKTWYREHIPKLGLVRYGHPQYQPRPWPNSWKCCCNC